MNLFIHLHDLHAIFQITKDEGAAPTETPAPVSDLLTDDDVQEKSVTSLDKTQSESRQALGKLDIADLIVRTFLHLTIHWVSIGPLFLISYVYSSYLIYLVTASALTIQVRNELNRMRIIRLL